MSRLGLALAIIAAATSTARAEEPTPPAASDGASDSAAATSPTDEPATVLRTEAASEPASEGTKDLTSSSRRLDSLHADVACRDCTYHAPPDLKDQAIGANLGVATGGRVTPGGLRVEGHYLYQLADSDWFDGTASFTFGGGDASCFRDRMNDFLCDHGLADGKGVEVTAAVRHFISGARHMPAGKFWPFLRGGVGARIVRFSDDEVTGFAIPLHAGAGMRVSLTEGLALTALAELELGIGRFNQSLGWEPQLGASISAGAEFGL
jgi:hypothetical protein